MKIRFVPPEEVLIVQGEDLSINNYLFFIEKGSCDVTVKDKHKLRN